MQKNSICQVVSQKKGLWMKFPVSNGKLLLPCGGHLGYAIGTKITNLVEDHPVIISIMLQFHRLISFWRRFSKFQPIRTHYRPWQPCWISDQHQNNKSGRGPPNEHFCQDWSKSVHWFQRRRWKYEKLTDAEDDADDRRKVMTKAHMALWARWAKKCRQMWEAHIAYCTFSCKHKHAIMDLD